MSLSITDFAAKIKAKHPDYAGIDDTVLVNKIIEKYPDYKSEVDLTPVVQPKPEGVRASIDKSLTSWADKTVADINTPEEYPGQHIVRGIGNVAGVVPAVINPVIGKVARAAEDVALSGSPYTSEQVNAGIKKLVAPALTPVAKAAEKVSTGLKKETPLLNDLLTAGGNIVYAVPTVAGAAKIGSEMVTGGLRTAGEVLEKDIVPTSKPPAGISAQAQYQNAAAARAGIPLTRGEEAAAAGSKVPGGAWGAVERKIRSLPGSGKVFEKFNADKAAAGIKSIENVLGKPIGELDDDIAQKVADNIEKSYKDQKNLFAGAYASAVDQGKIAYIRGDDLALKLSKKLSNTREMSTVIPESEKKNIYDFVNKIGALNKPIQEGGGIVTTGGVGSNYESFKDLTSLVGAAKRRMQDKLSVVGAGLNEKQAAAATKVYGDIYSTLKAAEYNHLRIIGGNDLVNHLKTIDRMYAEEKGSMSTVKKLFGIDRNVGEKGYKDADIALDEMLTPKNAVKLDMALKYSSDETKSLIEQAAISKIIRGATKTDTIGGKEVISSIQIGQLDNAVRKYRPVLEKVLSKDKMQLLDDSITGMRRGNIGSVNLLDPSNPSGTGAKTALIGMVLESLLAGGGVSHGINLQALAAAVPIFGAQVAITNVLAKMATKQGLLSKSLLPVAKGLQTTADVLEAPLSAAPALQGIKSAAGKLKEAYKESPLSSESGQIGLGNERGAIGAGENPQIIIGKTPKNIDGYFDENTNTIHISNKLNFDERQKKIKHELTHFKQKQSGNLPTSKFGGYQSGYVDYLSDPSEVAARAAETGEKIPEIWNEIFKLREQKLSGITDKNQFEVDKIIPSSITKIKPDRPVKDALDWHTKRLTGNLRQSDPQPVSVTEKSIRINLKNNANGIMAASDLEKQGFVEVTSSAPFSVDIPIEKNLDKINQILEKPEALQITAKSATGNSGAFSAANPDIRGSGAPPILAGTAAVSGAGLTAPAAIKALAKKWGAKVSPLNKNTANAPQNTNEAPRSTTPPQYAIGTLGKQVGTKQVVRRNMGQNEYPVGDQHQTSPVPPPESGRVIGKQPPHGTSGPHILDFGKQMRPKGIRAASTNKYTGGGYQSLA